MVSKLRLLCRYVFRPWDAGEDEPETARHVCFIAEFQTVVRGSLGHWSNSIREENDGGKKAKKLGRHGKGRGKGSTDASRGCGSHSVTHLVDVLACAVAS